MIKGIGIDMIELNRIHRMIQQNDRFESRILTLDERAFCDALTNERRRVEYIAGRFAAKEAATKAIGQGIGDIGFKDVEVLTDANGAPQISVTGYDETFIFISITHTRDYATAQVIIEDRK